jgi:hypothetical protein
MNEITAEWIEQGKKENERIRKQQEIEQLLKKGTIAGLETLEKTFQVSAYSSKGWEIVMNTAIEFISKKDTNGELLHLLRVIYTLTKK